MTGSVHPLLFSRIPYVSRPAMKLFSRILYFSSILGLFGGLTIPVFAFELRYQGDAINEHYFRSDWTRLSWKKHKKMVMGDRNTIAYFNPSGEIFFKGTPEAREEKLFVYENPEKSRSSFPGRIQTIYLTDNKLKVVSLEQRFYLTLATLKVVYLGQNDNLYLQYYSIIVQNDGSYLAVPDGQSRVLDFSIELHKEIESYKQRVVSTCILTCPIGVFICGGCCAIETCSRDLEIGIQYKGVDFNSKGEVYGQAIVSTIVSKGPILKEVALSFLFAENVRRIWKSNSFSGSVSQ